MLYSQKMEKIGNTIYQGDVLLANNDILDDGLDSRVI